MGLPGGDRATLGSAVGSSGRDAWNFSRSRTAEFTRAVNGTLVVGMTIPEATQVRFGRTREALTIPVLDVPGRSTERYFAFVIPPDGLDVRPNDILARDAARPTARAPALQRRSEPIRRVRRPPRPKTPARLTHRIGGSEGPLIDASARSRETSVAIGRLGRHRPLRAPGLLALPHKAEANGAPYDPPHVTDDRYGRILELLEQVPLPPEVEPPRGARPEQLDDLERRIGFSIPASLRHWLSLCNGYIGGPGGLYGACPDHDSLDIAARLDSWPEWRASRWVPVAGDGCGNPYVLDVAAGGPLPDIVYFIDCGHDPYALDYAVGSSIPHFLTFLLERELGAKGWPFEREYFLARDPDAASIDAHYVPWKVD